VDVVSPTRSIRIVLVSNAIEQLAFRFTQIALPLVVLHELDSAAAAGLVGGMSGLPVVTSPWWARRLRQRLADGRGLALVSLWQAAAVLVVPIALVAGVFHPVVLATVGLAVGVSHALGSPGRTALLGDLGDLLGEGAATQVVTWDDAVRRGAMVIGPALAGIGVHLGWTHALLWVEGFALVVSALLVRGVVVHVGSGGHAEIAGRVVAAEPMSGFQERCVHDRAPSILDSVRAHPDILRGWVMRGTSCLVWFAFALGLAVLGERTGQSGTLYATALTAYGIGSLVTTLVIARRPTASQPRRLGMLAWLAQGLAFAAMSLWTTPMPIALCAMIAGLVTVVGIRAMTQVLLVETSGAARRAALAGQSVLVDVTASVGMLAGGIIIDRFGPQPVLLSAGLLTAGIAVAAGTARPSGRHASGRRSGSWHHPTAYRRLEAAQKPPPELFSLYRRATSE
jgi:hypothetical protein